MCLTATGGKTKIDGTEIGIKMRCGMANGATTLIAIGLLVLIVLIVRFILKHGSAQNGGCSGNCGSCGMGCTSAFSPERKQFEDAMRSQRPSREHGEE
ncbi:hypothetical protein B6K86_09665 [Lachnospiraceae bacterium]|jgi:hypothetical protein|nr:hypothetical protein B6K86_09665 [Lachnospiraceae bacterium]